MTADPALEDAAVAYVMETWRDEDITEEWAREWVRKHGEGAKRRCRAAIVAYLRAEAKKHWSDPSRLLLTLAVELAPAPERDADGYPIDPPNINTMGCT